MKLSEKIQAARKAWEEVSGPLERIEERMDVALVATNYAMAASESQWEKYPEGLRYYWREVKKEIGKAHSTPPESLRELATTIAKIWKDIESETYGGFATGTIFDLDTINTVDAKDTGKTLQELLDQRPINLSNLNLIGEGLKGKDLQGANLEGSLLLDVDFQQANLDGATLESAIIVGANFQQAKIKNTNLSNAVYDQRTKWPQDFNPIATGALLQGDNKSTIKLLDGEDTGKHLDTFLFDSPADFSNANLTLRDLTGAELKSSSFVKADLSRANFQEAKIQKSDLTKARLVQTDLRNADCYMACFEKADLFHAILDGANLQKTNFKYAILSGADIKNAKLEGADFNGARMDGVLLSGSYFDKKTRWPDDFDPLAAGAIHRDLLESKLDWAKNKSTVKKVNGLDTGKTLYEHVTTFRENYSNPDDVPKKVIYGGLIAADLQRQNLDEIDLSRTIRARISLKESNLNGASLKDAILEGVDFHGANLSNTDFTTAKFLQVDLQQANLQNAKLNGARLSMTEIGGANFYKADLRGADFSLVLSTKHPHAPDPSAPIFKDALYDSFTKWPNWIDPEIAGAILVQDEYNLKSVSPIKLLIDPGDATAEELSELLQKLSDAYRDYGGSGVTFVLKESREGIEEGVLQ